MEEEKYSAGPISHFDLQVIKEFALKNNIEFDFEVDHHLKEQNKVFDEKDAKALSIGAKGVLPQLNFNHLHRPFVMIYFKKSDAFKMKKILQNLAIDINELKSDKESFEFIDAEDYICPECLFQSKKIGLCPSHGVQLLSYFDWKRYKNQPSVLGKAFNKFFRLFMIVLIVVGVGAAVFVLILSALS